MLKISKKDLYELKESDVIKIIESSEYKDIFNIWKNSKKIKKSKEKPKNKVQRLFYTLGARSFAYGKLYKLYLNKY